MNESITTTNLSYKIGSRTILNNINLHVPKGSIYGYLGRNGAGKSTTIKLLLGLLDNGDDTIVIQGNSLKRNSTHIHSITGNLIESPCFYTNLSVFENLRYLDIIYRMGSSRIDEVLEMVGLQREKKKKAKALSMGMKQRLGVAMAIFHDPELLVLDEPLNGLDPQGIYEMRKLFQRLQEQGKTIFLSSHILSELEKVATDIGIIENGRMIFQGTKDELLGQIKRQVHLQVNDVEAAISVLLALGFTVHQATNSTNIAPSSPIYAPDNDKISVVVDDNHQFNRLLKVLIEHKVEIYEIETQNANLEQTFINLIAKAND